MQTSSSLRRRVLVAISLVFGGIFVVVFLLLTLNHFLLQPAFLALERNQAIEDNDRAFAAIAQELAALTDISRDWAHWDAAYDFVREPTQTFIENNCPDNAKLSENSGIDILVFFNSAGDVLLKRAFHPGLGHPLALDLLSGIRPPILDLLPPTFQETIPRSGLIDTEHGLLLVTAEPIFPSENGVPPGGVLLIGRFIDAAKIASFAERTKVSLEILTRQFWTDENFDATFDPFAVAPSPDKVKIQRPFAWRVLFDINKKPVALLRTSIREDIAEIGRNTGYFLIVVLGSIALALLVCLTMYRWRMATAQKALQESESLYRQLFEAESDALFLIAQNTGRILAANQSATVLYGYTLAELFNLSDVELSAEQGPTGQIANDNLYNDGQVIVLPLCWHRKKDGTVFPVEITGRYFFHQGEAVRIVAIRDITERKRVEEQLYFTQFAVDHFGDSAFWTNRDGRLEYVNEEGMRSLGYSQEELIGKAVADIDPLFPFDKWPEHWKQLQEQKHLLFESIHKTKDNRVFPVEIRANYVIFGNREFNCAIVRDISERKLLERERAELEAMNWQMHKEESLGRMAGAIAHHFNNQLMIISGCIEMAHENLIRGRQEGATRNLDMALSSVTKASAISQSMLTYLGHNCFVERKPYDLSALCDQSLPVLRAIVPEMIGIRTELEKPGPIVGINGDHFLQILINLITNSVESFADDSGLIWIDIRTLATADLPGGAIFPVGWQPQNQNYGCVCVSDNGCGIAEDCIEKLFDPFYSTKFTGRGLGLAVVLGLIKTYNGCVRVEGVQGEGSIFSVVLPLTST